MKKKKLSILKKIKKKESWSFKIDANLKAEYEKVQEELSAIDQDLKLDTAEIVENALRTTLQQVKQEMATLDTKE